MTSPVCVDVTDLHTVVGRTLGPSAWTSITQPMVDTFADLTGDHQWIHVDPKRAADGPFGTTIAHGYLTLSLVPVIFGALLDVRGAAMGVNYGLERVRFPAPMRVGDDARGVMTLTALDQLDERGWQAQASVTIESRTSPKPVCVAQIVFRYYV